ncbi:hypothetical protein KCP77_02285 [Salmonella enterica subsp. enterica]|nr:hypothetical protein KCP77_02285 [Salmonella enterica subsp. enterica]
MVDRAPSGVTLPRWITTAEDNVVPLTTGVRVTFSASLPAVTVTAAPADFSCQGPISWRFQDAVQADVLHIHIYRLVILIQQHQGQHLRTLPVASGHCSPA